MSKKYSLDIYLPGNPGYDVACHIESDDPFLPIQKGDIINPRTWSSHYSSLLKTSYNESERKYGIVLRVTGIEHFIMQNEGGFSQHKLGIFTEAIDDIPETRP